MISFFAIYFFFSSPIISSSRQQQYSNWVLNFSIVIETILAAAFIYVPALNQVMQINTVDWHSFIWAFTFMVLMFLYEEFRKWIIRQFPSSSFFSKELLA